MSDLLKALAPAFGCGFAVQRLLEIIDVICSGLPSLGKYKKLVMTGAAVVAAFIFTLSAKLKVLNALGIAAPDPLDMAATTLIISAGTEGLNSILKFMDYKKEQAKSTAAPNSLVSKKGEVMQNSAVTNAKPNNFALQLTPIEQSPLAFVFYGITYLLSTPTEFQDAANGGADMSNFFRSIGITGTAALANCNAFTQNIVKNRNITQAIATFKAHLQAEAVYSPQPCPLTPQAVALMSKMVELADADHPGITKQ